MGIFDRLSSLIRSNINELISSAENPEKMLNQIIIDMRSQLAKAKQQVAAAIADEKRLHDQVEGEYKQAQEWERRAVLAVQGGQDDLAKQALVRYNEHSQHGQEMQATWESHRAETEKLKNSLRDLNDKIEEAKRKKNLLIARQKRAQAQQRIQETMSGMSDKSAFEAFARMEDKISDNERRMVAGAEIDAEFSGDRLSNEFTRLERSANTGSADMQLIALKQKMGMLAAGTPSQAASKQLGMGASAPNATADDAHIEELPVEDQQSK
ncbi:MAG: PspA/IM30 family protein [Gemmatimonadaceae bacterium]